MRQLDLFLDATPITEEQPEVIQEVAPTIEQINEITEPVEAEKENLVVSIPETHTILTAIAEVEENLEVTLSPELLESWEQVVPMATVTTETENDMIAVEEPLPTANEENKPHVLDVVQFESIDLADGNEPLLVPKIVTSVSKKVSVILPALETTVEDTRLSAKQLTKITQPKKRGRKSIKQMEAEADAINVPIDEVLFQKQYYTMGEVCAMFNVNHSLLRYWEGEFTVLQPRKNRKGDRLFRPEDVKNIEVIYKLTRINKYTIQGAKDYFKNQKLAAKKFEIVQQLEQLRKFLLEIKAKM